jgi:threonine/homoserine/homoserine lactone efflux protein
MDILIYIALGFAVSIAGSIMPSMLNLTVVKFSLKSGFKSALFLILGICIVLIIQSNIGAYFSNILMNNSEYITTIQKIGTGILFLISINFFRMYAKSKKEPKKERIQKSTAFFHGLVLSLLNTFAIPFYFTAVSFLIASNYFEYTFTNSLYFSLGSGLGSFVLYFLYAITAKKTENRIFFLANKMDLILGCLTGIIAIMNVAYLVYK